MRVRADKAFRTYVNGTLLRASEGSVWEGGAARAMLASRCPVTELDEPAPAAGDETPEETPEEDEQTEEQTEEPEGVPEGNVSDVLDWVDGDAGRAQAALDAERERERPRSSLVKQLTDIIG